MSAGAARRKGKPTPPDDYVPTGLILYMADQALPRVLAWIPGIHAAVDHGIDPVSRHARAIVYVSASPSSPAITGLVITLRAYDDPLYGVLDGNRVVECEDLGDAIREVAVKVEAAGQLSLAL